MKILTNEKKCVIIRKDGAEYSKGGLSNLFEQDEFDRFPE